MRRCDANSWELYREKSPLEKKSSKKQQRIKRDNYNTFMAGVAKRNARAMRRDPSELEKRMKEFLDNQHIIYEFQKVFNIKDDKGYIRKSYIADFFLPRTGIIIETDGKFHDNQIESDRLRTKDIQTHCGNYRVVRWRWHDFQSLKKIKALIALLK